MSHARRRHPEWQPDGRHLAYPGQVAAACTVEPEWLTRHIDEGLFPHVERFAGTWRFSSASLVRARRMRQLERDFDAVPELAALVAICWKKWMTCGHACGGPGRASASPDLS